MTDVASPEIESAGLTHVGIQRRGSANEDAFHVQPQSAERSGVLLVVADGMGGAAAGEVASARAIEAVRQTAFSGDSRAFLETAFARANADVHRLAANPEAAGAGTTLAAAYLEGDRVWVANVGDSRAYRFRDGRIEQLTVDHSYVQEAVAAGRLTPAEARDHPRRSYITRSIGPHAQVEVDIGEHDLREGDLVLLCSDGLWEPVDDETLTSLIEERGEDPRATAEALVETALARGGPDNVTVALARVRSGSSTMHHPAPASVREDAGPTEAASRTARLDTRTIVLGAIGLATAASLGLVVLTRAG